MGDGRPRSQSVRRITIYLEGGGRGEGRRALRRGMMRFLRPVKEAFGGKALYLGVVPCGSREETWNRFRREAASAGPGETCVLVVDAEGPVEESPRAHLRVSDGWDLSGIPGDAVHLMVQVMETWIVADPEALARYYGQGFRRARLPKRTNLEQEPKARILDALNEATRHTGKGAYHKINHAVQLLRRTDPAKVRSRCDHCERLFNELHRIVEAA